MLRPRDAAITGPTANEYIQREMKAELRRRGGIPALQKLGGHLLVPWNAFPRDYGTQLRERKGDGTSAAETPRNRIPAALARLINYGRLSPSAGALTGCAFAGWRRSGVPGGVSCDSKTPTVPATSRGYVGSEMNSYGETM